MDIIHNFEVETELRRQNFRVWIAGLSRKQMLDQYNAELDRCAELWETRGEVTEEITYETEREVYTSIEMTLASIHAEMVVGWNNIQDLQDELFRRTQKLTGHSFF